MNKPVNLSDFDFGFTAVDEDELDSVRSLSETIEQSSEEVERLESEAQEWRDKANAIHMAILPLLNNLMSNPEKDYLFWPNRVDRVEAFKTKLNDIIEG